MKRKKLIIVPLVMSLLMGITTGCSLSGLTPAATEEMLVETFENMDSGNLYMTVQNDIIWKRDGEKYDLDVTAKIANSFSIDGRDYLSKTKSSVNFTTDDFDESHECTTYLVREDGTTSSYMNYDESDWYAFEDSKRVLYSKALGKMIKKTELNSFENNSKDSYYTVGGTCSANDLFECVFTELYTLAELDDMTSEVTVFVDKETKTPVKLTFAFYDTTKVTTDDYKFTVNDFIITVVVNDINEKVKIKIPKEALAAESDEESDELSDGFYEPVPALPDDVLKVNEDGYKEGLIISEEDAEYLADVQYASNIGENGTVYLCTVNYSDEDKRIYATAHFYKDFLEVDSSSGYISMEADTYAVESFYCFEEFDTIQWVFEKEYDERKLMGSEIDIDYKISGKVLSGVLTNNTEDTMRSAMVGFVVWDEEKRVLYFTTAYPDAIILKPGESTTFETYLTYPVDDKTDFTIYTWGYVNEYGE